VGQFTLFKNVSDIEMLNRKTALDLHNPTPETITDILHFLINSGGFETINAAKPALRQILESLLRNDITTTDAVRLYDGVFSGSITTKEEVEQLAEPKTTAIDATFERFVTLDQGNSFTKTIVFADKPIAAADFEKLKIDKGSVLTNNDTGEVFQNLDLFQFVFPDKICKVINLFPTSDPNFFIAECENNTIAKIEVISEA